MGGVGGSGAELNRALEVFPLEDWLTRQGFEPEGDNWIGTCPHCGKRKLSVHPVRKIWRCWVCHRPGHGAEGSGRTLALVAWLFGLSKADAIAVVLAEAAPYARNDQIPDLVDPSEGIEEWADPLLLAGNPFPPEAKLACASLPYLRQRGISPAEVQAYGIQHCEGGFYAGRILFTDWHSGQPRYWQARATWKDPERKALNPKTVAGRVTAESSVFNLERAVGLGRGHIAICEGPISAIHAGDDAVATWGKRISWDQIRLLQAFGVRSVELYFDGPSESEPVGAWQEQIALAPVLASFFDVSLVFVPRGDPGDYDRTTNAQIRAARQHHSLYHPLRRL